MRAIIIGPPGAGKGTLAQFICRLTACRHVSTGDMFRKNIREKTALGREASEYIQAGLLVPDTVTNAMVRRLLLDEIKTKAFLLDGYPRKMSQVEALESYLEELDVQIDTVFEVGVPDSLIVERLTGRRICSACGESYHVKFAPAADGAHCDRCGAEIIQRPDDREETVLARLDVYHQETEPLIAYYREKGLLHVIDNSGSLEMAQNNIRAITGKMEMS